MNYLFRTVVLAALVGLGYLGYEQATGVLDGHRAEVAEREVEIRELNTQLVVREQRIGGLEKAVAQQVRQRSGGGERDRAAVAEDPVLVRPQAREQRGERGATA